MPDNEEKLLFWSVPVSEILKELRTPDEGLEDLESNECLKKYGINVLKPKSLEDGI